MKVDFESIYEHIGYLFYGFVCEEEEPSTSDLVKLTELVERIWRPMINGDPGLHLHLADCIHVGIRYALENRMRSEQALSSFRDYYQIHSLAFSPTLKEKVITSISAILKEFPNHSSKSIAEGSQRF